MFVVDVIALSPTSPAAPLSYRSRERLTPGTVVSILLRKTPVHGIVVSSTEVKDAKATLKSASFALVKSVTRTDGILPGPLMRSAEAIASYHAVPLGSVLHAILSDAMAKDLPRVLNQGEGFHKDGLEFPKEVRFRKYRSLIEDERRSKRATLLVCPTIAELSFAKEYFADMSPTVLSGEVEAAERKVLIEEATASWGLVIASPSFSFVPIKALGRILIERPSAGTYRMPRRPNLDYAASLLLYAEARALPVALGDYPLPLEHRERPLIPLATEPKGSVEAIDVREKVQGATWSALPESTLRRIKDALKNDGRIVVLAARKGYAPSVVCRDCGTTQRDPEGRAYSLATQGGKRVFRTADGKSVIGAKALCSHCGSWNLMPLGVAVERVAEELKAAFPDTPLKRFDTDSVRTDVQARKALKAFKDKRGILVGTESMLPWLSSADDLKLSLAVVASMDSFLALPFWRARERFVRIGLMLRELAPHTIIHTRLTDDTALKTVLMPKEDGFFLEEATLRQALMYPPFGTLVAFHIEGGKKRLLEAKVSLIEAVMPRALSVLPERHVVKSTYRLTALLHLPKGEWPNAELSARLQALPPFIKIAVDPESLW